MIHIHQCSCGYRNVCYTNNLIIESFKYLNINNSNPNGNNKTFPKQHSKQNQNQKFSDATLEI